MHLEAKPQSEFQAPKASLAQQSGNVAGVRAFRPLTPQRLIFICVMLLAALFVAVVIALRMGTFPISIRQIVLTLFNGAIGRRAEIPSDYWLVVFGLRLPRIALGILVGAALSTAGAGYQALLRNPLADPYVLGVSSGAALGAIISLVVAPRVPGLIQLAAFVGAVGTIAVVYFLGRRGGQLDSGTLLLAGIVTASFLSAVIMFLMTTLSGRDLRGMSFWLMGDLATPPSVNMGWLYFLLAIGVATIYGTAADLNLILTGEQEARHLGVNVNRVKLVVYIAASILTGLAVSVSGAIGFLGLLVPHVMRMMFGTDYRVLIPTSAIGGAILIVLADTLARTVVAPTELPVGAMTAIAGAPLFIYLMRRRVR